MTDTNISLILDDFVSSSAESSSPEKVLFLAVILQAVLDATKPYYHCLLYTSDAADE